jgi:cysteinyl-tRNA synthetase
MALKIYNTLSAKKELFQPIEPKKVKMYVCGMTVYDYCHIGHARVLVSFDVITRYLRHSGYDVTYIRNITDVDDKIFARAAENGEPYDALTQRFIDAMHEDEKALLVKSPDQEPRATAHISEIIAMIERLIANEHAYAADNGDVYYAIDKFKNYGQLSKRNTEELLAGARIDVDQHKRNPLDFVLWKAAKPGEASWPSPWGDGRPGWHIECSAMSTCCLGDTFDIHGGGPDLKFPHHENEIAQSEGATGKKYVNYWMHAGAVRVNKEKMSKSLGNFFTIREVLEKYPAEVVRLFLISSHYRSEIDYSEESLAEAKDKLDRFYQSLRGDNVKSDEELDERYLIQFKEAMDDDFNTPLALAILFQIVSEINISIKDEVLKDNVPLLRATLRNIGATLGILQSDPESYFKGSDLADGLSSDQIDHLVAERTAARASKNWAESDRIRDLLLAEGITLDDSKDGTTWRRS